MTQDNILGHPQREHETAHGSMQHAVWALEGPDGSSVEVNGHRFGAQDSGAPQLCSMYCSHRGRHAHVDFCRNWPEPCREVELEHARERIEPQPDRPKDWISHRLFWARTGTFPHSVTKVDPLILQQPHLFRDDTGFKGRCWYAYFRP